MASLRAVKVMFDSGDSITTSMAAHLSDDDIRDYYKIGRVFNIGNVTDLLAKVATVTILK